MCEWHQNSVSVAGRSPVRIVDQGPTPPPGVEKLLSELAAGAAFAIANPVV